MLESSEEARPCGSANSAVAEGGFRWWGRGGGGDRVRKPHMQMVLEGKWQGQTGG